MNISTETYGTTGLPKFGPSAFDGSRSGAISEVESAFNQLMTTVKKYTNKGNEQALIQFGLALQQAWTPAHYAVAGKPVVNS